MHKTTPFVFLFAAILLAWLCIRLDTTPARVNRDPAGSEFSEPQAMAHLQQIAKTPHSTGTPANRAARDYILNTCAALGLDTAIQHATSVIPQGSGVVSANVYNIIARIKGSASSKAVLIAAHYDSQPNAGGAGDDGSGCAAMLETARALKAGRPLKNDVIFLFSDDEEDGLLGAFAFVRENPLLKEVGVMLNFDARGASGANLLSETNPDNGWVIDGYARSAAHHNASSLNYEVYKRLPNSTDYTPFKNAGIAGLNNAFIGGFVHYHSITDVPADLDPNTLQEEGDNMLAQARYFGNQDIRDTKAPDLSFFNLIGGWFIRYPASLNMIFLVLTNILLLMALFIGFVKKQVRIPGLLSGFLAFPVMLLILYFVSDWTLRGIRLAAPLYEGYYSNTYHPGYYFLALTALGIAVFTLLYRWLLGRFGMPSLLAGTLIILTLLLDGLYIIMPTAIYFLCFPLIIFLGGSLFTFFSRRIPRARTAAAYSYPGANYARPAGAFSYPAASSRTRPVATSSSANPAAAFILLVPAILFLAPIYYMFFVAFDLQPTSAAVPALIGLLLGLSLPLIDLVCRQSRWLIPGGAFALFLITLTLGLVHQSPTPTEPLKTNLQYVVNADQGKAWWVSLTTKPDSWNKRFFPNAKLLPTQNIFLTGLYGLPKVLTNEAPLQNAPAPTLTVRKDTTIDGQRRLSLHLQAAPGTNSVYLNFEENSLPANIIVDGRSPLGDGQERHYVAGQFGYRWLEYKGIPADGFDFQLQMNSSKPVDLSILNRFIGLPGIQDFKAYPSGIIPGPGNYSNTTIVVKKFSL